MLPVWALSQLLLLLACGPAVSGKSKVPLPRFFKRLDADPIRLGSVEPILLKRFLDPLEDISVKLKQLDKQLAFLLDSYSHFKQHLKDVHELRLSPWVIDILSDTGVIGSTPYSDGVALAEAIRHVSEKLMELPPWSCYPILRRVILAAVVRQRLAPTFVWAESQELQQSLSDLMWQLLVQHRHGAGQKFVMEFFHVSKSGGTSMCAVSAMNGCKSRDRSLYGNCMMRRFDDNPRWVSHRLHNKTDPITEDLAHLRWFYRYHIPRGERTCDYRRKIMKETNNTFYSNEFAVHGGFKTNREAYICPKFLNVLMLRHPTTRTTSHLKWIIKVYKAVYEAKNQTLWVDFFRDRNAAYWTQFAPAAVNNYYVRLLNGEAVFRRHELEESHLTVAKLMAMQYDVILTLESSREDKRSCLKWGLGWQHSLDEVHTRQVKSVEEQVEKLLPPDKDQLLATANTLDERFYEFGSLLANLDGIMYDTLELSTGATPLPYFGRLRPSQLRCGYLGSVAFSSRP